MLQLLRTSAGFSRFRGPSFVNHFGPALAVSVSLMGLLAPLAAQAQTAPPAAPTPDVTARGETLQRQQQEIMQEDTTRILTSPSGQTVIEVPTHQKAVAAPGTCQTITRIDFEHSPMLEEARRNRLITPYLGRCLGLGDVENLLSDITRYYIDKGRPTTRVYIKPQSLAQGVLVLDIVEGRVEQVQLEESAKGTVNLTTAFGDVRNRAFNLRVFEQGLDQINRLASNHASLDILPGSEPGNSIVRITNRPTSRFHASASYDDTGQPATGRRQATGAIIVDHLLGLNDMISYTRRQTVFEDKPNADSRSNSWLFSVPWNALTLSGGYSDASYVSQTSTTSGTVFVLTGNTRTAFGRIDATAWRNSRNKVDISAQLTSKRNRNYINDIFLPVSSRQLTTLDIDINWSILLGNGSLKLGAGWTRGLDMLGALDDGNAPLPASTPRAQFDKTNARAYLALPFRVGRQRITWTSEIEAQYAFVPLYSSEQIVIGSPYTVRGFLEGSLIADRGVYAKQELSTLIPMDLGVVDATLRPHLGLDAGYVASIAPGGVSGTIAGLSAGLGFAAGPLNLDFVASRSVARGPLPDEGLLTFVRATLSF